MFLSTLQFPPSRLFLPSFLLNDHFAAVSRITVIGRVVLTQFLGSCTPSPYALCPFRSLTSFVVCRRVSHCGQALVLLLSSWRLQLSWPRWSTLCPPLVLLVPAVVLLLLQTLSSLPSSCPPVVLVLSSPGSNPRSRCPLLVLLLSSSCKVLPWEKCWPQCQAAPASPDRSHSSVTACPAFVLLVCSCCFPSLILLREGGLRPPTTTIILFN